MCVLYARTVTCKQITIKASVAGIPTWEAVSHGPSPLRLALPLRSFPMSRGPAFRPLQGVSRPFPAYSSRLLSLHPGPWQGLPHGVSARGAATEEQCEHLVVSDVLCVIVCLFAPFAFILSCYLTVSLCPCVRIRYLSARQCNFVCHSFGVLASVRDCCSQSRGFPGQVLPMHVHQQLYALMHFDFCQWVNAWSHEQHYVNGGPVVSSFWVQIPAVELHCCYPDYVSSRPLNLPTLLLHLLAPAFAAENE
jgi:hypothetical protein